MKDHIVHVKISYNRAYNHYFVRMECGTPVFIERDHSGDAELKRVTTCTFLTSGRSLHRKIKHKLKRAQKRYVKTVPHVEEPEICTEYNLTENIDAKRMAIDFAKSVS